MGFLEEAMADGITCAGGCAAHTRGLERAVNVLILAGLVACCAAMIAAIPFALVMLVLTCLGIADGFTLLLCLALAVAAFEAGFYLGHMLTSAAEKRADALPYDAFLEVMEKRGNPPAGKTPAETGRGALPWRDPCPGDGGGETEDGGARSAPSPAREDAAAAGRVWSFPPPAEDMDAGAPTEDGDARDRAGEERLERLERKAELLRELVELERKDREEKK